jgi:hypothetical protein
MGMSTYEWESLATNVIRKLTPTSIPAKLAGDTEAHPGIRNSGACQSAHTRPKTAEAQMGPNNASSLGKAYPRQPGSSPSGPPRIVDQLMTVTDVKTAHLQRARGPAPSRNAGITVNAIAIRTGPAKAARRTRVVKRVAAKARKSRFANQWVITAATVGAKVGTTINSGGMFWIGMTTGKKNSHASPKASRKNTSSGRF